MRYLLDTHAFLWWTASSDRLPAELVRILPLPENIIYLSVGSLWEIAIKLSIGELSIDDPERFLNEATEAYGVELLPVRKEHVLEVLRLPLLHKDPFDRLIVAQARLEGLSIVTADAQLAQYDIAITWPTSP